MIERVYPSSLSLPSVRLDKVQSGFRANISKEVKVLVLGNLTFLLEGTAATSLEGAVCSDCDALEIPSISSVQHCLISFVL